MGKEIIILLNEFPEMCGKNMYDDVTKWRSGMNTRLVPKYNNE